MNKNAETFLTESKNYKEGRPEYPRELFEFINTQLQSNNKAWDCACGTGQVAKFLVDYFAMVEASDISEQQIINAVKHSTIHYSVQSSEKTSFADSSFDLVCVAQALHWFNIPVFFKEVQRVLKKDGVFVCMGYACSRIDSCLNDEIDELIETYINVHIKDFWSEGNRLLWNNYKGVDFPFQKIESPVFKMKQNWNQDELIKYMKTWSSYKLFKKTSDRDIFTEFSEAAKTLWPNDVKMNIVWDLAFYCGRYI